MKNKKRILFVLILCILNVILIYKLRLISTSFGTTISELKSKNEKLLNVENKYQNNFIIAKENENLNLKQDLKLLTIEGDTITVKEAFKKAAIILRYSVLNCDVCVEAEFNVLKDLAPLLTDEICIITYYERIRGLINDYKKMQQKGLGNMKIYLLIDNQLDLPIELYNCPYYFHIDSNLRVNNFFIPMKENPKLSKYYLRYGLKNYFNKIVY